jgi:hypothetical protein
MLPKQLKFGSKIESSPAKCFKSNVQPNGGTGNYNLGDTIQINIPTRANLCLVPSESFLKFDVIVNGATANTVCRWDSCGAHGIIQKLKVMHGSNVLSEIDNYGMFAKALFDLQVPTDAVYGKYSILAGTRPDQTVTLPAITAVAGAALADLVTSVNTNIQTVLNGAVRSSLQVNSGDILSSVNTAGGNTTKKTYCLNLLNLLGTLCPNYIPLFACTSAPLRLEITLVDSLNKALASTAVIGNPTGGVGLITNCEYVAQMIELSDGAMGMIQSSLNGQPLQFVAPDYRNYNFAQVTLSDGANTQVQVPIPAKFSSLKSIIASIRDKGVGTDTFFPFSSVRLSLNEFQFRIGATLMPPKAPNTIPEMFSEVLKAVGSMSNLDHHPSIESFTYSLNQSVAHTATGAQSSGSFYVGIDLENYPGTRAGESLFAGFNSNTDDVYLILNYGNAPAAGIVPRIDSFAMFDSVYVFDNNTAYQRF